MSNNFTESTRKYPFGHPPNLRDLPPSFRQTSGLLREIEFDRHHPNCGRKVQIIDGLPFLRDRVGKVVAVTPDGNYLRVVVAVPAHVPLNGIRYL